MNQNTLKALIGSAIGIFLFFIPISDGDSHNIPLVIIINAFKHAVGKNTLNLLIIAILFLLCCSWLASRFTNIEAIKKFHGKDHPIVGLVFLLSLIVAIMVQWQIGPEWVLNDDVGGLAVAISRTVITTVIIAGIGVIFLIEFGILEFLGTVLEPFMRPLYRTPGVSAVDAITSFVAAPAVGIFMTNKLYKQKTYTQREAATIASSFSICSLGFFAYLAGTGDILPYLPHIILTSFIINFILAIIMARIPPLSWKKDLYIDGTPFQTSQPNYNEPTLKRAGKAAAKRASRFTLSTFYHSSIDAILFAVKIVGYVISVATIALIIATYTDLFKWIGMIFEPYLHLLQLPDVEKIAPTVLIGISEIALPAVLIKGASTAAVFFVCTLTTVQIIFFTESANAMLESEIPLNLWDVLLIFIIRTLLGIPLVALATHLIF